jgi:hypothetical protein
MLKKNFIWFHLLSQEEKSFHARPSPTQPIKSFTTHYPHLHSAFPLLNRALSMSFRLLSQQRPGGENLLIIAHPGREGFPSFPTRGNGQFSKIIFIIMCSVEIFLEHSTGRFLKNLQNEGFTRSMCTYPLLFFGRYFPI